MNTHALKKQAKTYKKKEEKRYPPGTKERNRKKKGKKKDRKKQKQKAENRIHRQEELAMNMHSRTK